MIKKKTERRIPIEVFEAEFPNHEHYTERDHVHRPEWHEHDPAEVQRHAGGAVDWRPK